VQICLLRIMTFIEGVYEIRISGVSAISRINTNLTTGGNGLLLHNDSGESYPVSFLSLQLYDVETQMHDWDKAFDWEDLFRTPSF
jgi:hypothetical protein